MATAFTRLAVVSAQAERAAMDQMTELLQQQLNISLARGQAKELGKNLNPFKLLLNPPSNYAGEINRLDSAEGLQKGHWYFERSSGELIYHFQRLSYLPESQRQPIHRYKIDYRYSESQLLGAVILADTQN